MIDGGCESEFGIGNAEFGNEDNTDSLRKVCAINEKLHWPYAFNHARWALNSVAAFASCH
jgi:hypothetical protein